MKYFLLSCLTVVSLTACHVENGYYYDVPNYNSYHGHRHQHQEYHRGYRHESRQAYVPGNRHGHDEVVVQSPERRTAPSNYHGHNDERQVVIGGSSSAHPSNVHGH